MRGMGVRSVALALAMAIGASATGAHAGEPALPVKVDEVHKEFNKIARSMGFDLRASRKKCGTGVQKVCQYEITKNAALIAIAKPDNPNAEEVTAINSFEYKDYEGAANSIVVYSILLRLLSPGEKKEEYGDAILSLLERFKESEKGQIEFGSVSYKLAKMEGMGIWFIASPIAAVD